MYVCNSNTPSRETRMDPMIKGIALVVSPFSISAGIVAADSIQDGNMASNIYAQIFWIYFVWH